jgi:hypothetical protein
MSAPLWYRERGRGSVQPVDPSAGLRVPVGWDRNDQSTRFFSNVGFGWQF